MILCLPFSRAQPRWPSQEGGDISRGIEFSLDIDPLKEVLEFSSDGLNRKPETVGDPLVRHPAVLVRWKVHGLFDSWRVRKYGFPPPDMACSTHAIQRRYRPANCFLQPYQ